MVKALKHDEELSKTLNPRLVAMILRLEGKTSYEFQWCNWLLRELGFRKVANKIFNQVNLDIENSNVLKNYVENVSKEFDKLQKEKIGEERIAQRNIVIEYAREKKIMRVTSDIVKKILKRKVKKKISGEEARKISKMAISNMANAKIQDDIISLADKSSISLKNRKVY